jgi:CRP-like cAMP-binding protein
MSNTILFAKRGFFGVLTPGEMSRLEKLLPVKEYRKGHVFWKAGSKLREDSPAVFIIMEGQVSVASEVSDITQVPVARTLNAGEMFGLVTFLQSEVHTATCRAATKVMAASITRAEFESLRSKDLPLGTALMFAMARQLARDVRACNQRLVDAIRGPAAKPAR